MLVQDSIFLSFAYNVLRWIGVFPSNDCTAWKRWAFNFYRMIIFIVLFLGTFLMAFQMCVATDLTLLARTIDIWTMFSTGLYKWLCMAVFDDEFAKLKTAFSQIQYQGSMAYGRSADLFTANYLKQMPSISFWYLFSGVVAAFLIIISPLLTYPKG